jgi:hypothetical protein
MAGIGTIAGNVSTLPGDSVTTDQVPILAEKLDQIIIELRKLNSHMALINDKIITEEDILIDEEDSDE